MFCNQLLLVSRRHPTHLATVTDRATRRGTGCSPPHRVPGTSFHQPSPRQLLHGQGMGGCLEGLSLHQAAQPSQPSPHQTQVLVLKR